MKRAYELNLPVCPDCGGLLRVLQVVLRADVIDRVLDHLDRPTIRFRLESRLATANAA